MHSLAYLADPDESNVGDSLGSRDSESIREFVVESVSLHLLTGKGTDSSHGGDDFLSYIVRDCHCILSSLREDLRESERVRE